MPNCSGVRVWPLVAFHPRPQIASDLGRNVTRSPNPHQNRKRFPSGNEIFGLWPQTQIATGLNPLRFENRKPNPPLYLCFFELPKSQPAGRNRRIRAAKAAANRKIAGHKATKVWPSTREMWPNMVKLMLSFHL